ncbi:MAG: class II aldolase/adducin family protein [Sphingomonadales bacterium]
MPLGAVRRAAGKNHSASRSNDLSEAEWRARTDLAACYRLVAHFGMTDTIFTHISARVPDQEDAFLVNAFGLMYEEITASNLVKVNLAGDILSDTTGLGINPAGFVIHGAIHGARHDVQCVLHTHTPAGIAVSAQKHGLLPISLQSAALQGRIGYHDFEGIAVHMEEQERLVANLGRHYVMILNNHGLLTAGRTTGEALRLMLTLERACQAQVLALGGAAEVRHVTPESIASTHETLDGGVVGAERDWSSMLRLAARIAPDYLD